MDVQFTEMGKRIKTRRTEQNIKQNVLAEKLNISNNHLSAIENGKEKPSLDILLKICRELEVTPDYLLFGIMNSNNVPMYISENLRLCSKEDIALAKLMVDALVERNQKKWNETNYN